MADEVLDIVTITAIDTGDTGDNMSRNFSTTFKGNESPEMLKEMVLDWEKKEVQPKYRRYHLVTSDFIDMFSEPIQKTLEELEVSE